MAYRSNLVPVGIDQKQHLELTKAIVKKVNQFLKEDFFEEPKPLFTKISKVMSFSNPAVKKSNSLGPRNYISVFYDPDVRIKKIISAVTDIDPTKTDIGAGMQNLFSILVACGTDSLESSLRQDYFSGSLKYSHLKSETSKILIDTFSPIREKRLESDEIADNDVIDLIHAQSEIANQKDSVTVQALAEALGIN